MKKTLSVILSCVMFSTLLFAGCNAAPKETSSENIQAPIEEMLIGR